MKRWLCRIFILLFVVTSMIGVTRPSFAGSHLETKNSVVRVLAMDDSSEGTGSGFGIGAAGKAPEYFITNRHVVFNSTTGQIMDEVYLVLEDDAIVLTYLYGPLGNSSIDQEYYWVATSIEKQDALVRCEVLYPTADDPEFPDVAILKAERPVTERIAAPLKSGWDIETGTNVYSMGFPSSADKIFRGQHTGQIVDLDDLSFEIVYANLACSSSSMTIGSGVLSSVVNMPEYDGETVFQHTAEMNHGNSGGPLVDEEGYVVAINTYGFNTANNGVAEYKASVFIDYAMMELDKLGIHYDVYSKLSVASLFYIIPGVILIGGVIAWIIWLMYRKKNQNSYVLIGKSGIYAGKRIPIKGKLLIGRNPDSGLVFPTNTPGVSARHCMLEAKKGQLMVCDLNSSFGTFVNGEKLLPGVSVTLRPRDVISLADQSNSFVAEKL